MFGSVLDDLFRDHSDLDLLVDGLAAVLDRCHRPGGNLWPLARRTEAT